MRATALTRRGPHAGPVRRPDYASRREGELSHIHINQHAHSQSDWTDRRVPGNIEKWKAGFRAERRLGDGTVRLTPPSTRTIRKYLINLNGIFRRAREAYGISANPVADVKRPGREFSTNMRAEKVQIGRTWNATPTFSRITVGTQAEMEKFKVAFKKCYEMAPLPASAHLDMPFVENPMELNRHLISYS